MRLRGREQAGDEDGQKANEENQTVSGEMEQPGMAQVEKSERI